MTETAIARYAEDPATAAAVQVYRRLEVVRNALAPDLDDAELTLFSLVAQRSGLDPFARQIHAVKRKGKVTFQTGIDGYRSTAERTREYEGSDLPEFGPECECKAKPEGHPLWARVTVYRTGKRPQTGEAYWHEFHPGDNDFMWVKMPRNQLAKCAEALALRKAFPYVFADLYTNEEMAQAGREENTPVTQAAAQPTAKERLAARRAALEAPTTAEPAPVAEEASFRDADATPEAPAAPEASCDAPSPYDDTSERCTQPKGHEGHHRNAARESWNR